MNINLKAVFSCFVCVAILGLATTSQASVVNVNIFVNAGTGGSGPNTGVTMDGTAYTGSEAPVAYTGTKWNDLSFTGGAGIALEDSDGNTIGNVNGNGPASAWSYNSGGGLNALENYWYAATSIDITGLAVNSLWDVYVFGADSNEAAGSTFTIGGTTLNNSGVPNATATWTDGLNYSKFSSVDAGALGAFTITRDAGPINGFQLVLVPEPATLGLVGLGGLLMLVRSRRA